MKHFNGRITEFFNLPEEYRLIIEKPALKTDATVKRAIINIPHEKLPAGKSIDDLLGQKTSVSYEDSTDDPLKHSIFHEVQIGDMKICLG